jgi:hypothetical protein
VAPPSPLRQATANSDGTFRFDHLEDGEFFLVVTAQGFVPANVGAGGARRSGRPFDIRNGASILNTKIELEPFSELSGRISGENDQPIRGAQVYVMTLNGFAGDSYATPEASAVSGSSGEYRVKELPAGRYTVCATVPQAETASIIGSDATKTKAEGYGEVLGCYPSSPTADISELVSIPPGEVIDGISLKLPTARLFGVRGRVRGLGADLLKSASVLVYLSGQVRFVEPLRRASLDPRGGFSFEGLPQGSYLLRLIVRIGSPDVNITTVGEQQLEVDDTDLDSVVLSPAINTKIAGRIHFADGVTANVSALKLLLRAEPGVYSNPKVEIQPDGSFTISALSPVRYKASLVGLPTPAYISSVSLDRHPLPGPILDLSSGREHSLTIEVVNGTAEISAETDTANDALSETHSTLLMFPLEPQLEAFSPHGNLATDGNLTRRGVPPGDYLVFAADSFTLIQSPEIWQDQDFLQAIRHDGLEVKLEENDRKQISLPLLTDEKIDRALQSIGRFHQ